MKAVFLEGCGIGGWCRRVGRAVTLGFRAQRAGACVVLGVESFGERLAFGTELRIATLTYLGGAREDVGVLSVGFLRWTLFVRLSVTIGQYHSAEELFSPPPQDDGVKQSGQDTYE